MIVDDEEPVLESFSFIIKKDLPNFMICGKARTGNEAVKLIAEMKPDVVFMDIQMPGIDGLEAINRIQVQYPEIVFILATAYERFDIAQRAIPLRVFSYLVKPISRKTIIGELDKVKKHLDRRQQQTAIHIEDAEIITKTRENIKNRFLFSLFWDNPTETEWNEFASIFNLKHNHGRIYMIEIGGTINDEKKRTVYSAINEKIQYKVKCFHLVFGSRILFFFPEDKSLDRLENYFNAVISELKPIPIILGRGDTRHYSELHHSFREAFIQTGHDGGEARRYIDEKNRTRDILKLLLNGGFEEGGILFEDFWMDTFLQDRFEIAKTRMLVFFIRLFDSIDHASLSSEKLDIDLTEMIISCRNVWEWRRWTEETFRRLKKILYTPHDMTLPKHLTTAVTYIKNNYDKPIQLTNLARECCVTSTYMSRLFSKYLRTSFIDYLNKYRVEQASILLKNKKHTIKEIAYMVGYQDPNYFSRIFRRVMGIAPSDMVTGRTHEDV